MAKSIYFSFIIPVFNRPEETRELLESFTKLNFKREYEIVIVEDGSKETSEAIVNEFSEALNISYYFKENSGPGDSRNYGMKKAKGNYFIILDSDCILPSEYLEEVNNSLSRDFVHCFGGPDAALDSFSDIQKAINFVMTSPITTGGVRGGKKQLSKFQPRSFNMGLSKEAFLASKGFGNIHPGEDPDLTLRLWELGYRTKLIAKAHVYHKRRISWSKFYTQVKKFGLCRPILNTWHPKSESIVFYFPSVFTLGFITALLLVVFGQFLLINLYYLYFLTVVFLSFRENKSFKIGIYSLFALFIQFFGYGFAFIKSTLLIRVLKKDANNVFPFLFFKL